MAGRERESTPFNVPRMGEEPRRLALGAAACASLDSHRYSHDEVERRVPSTGERVSPSGMGCPTLNSSTDCNSVESGRYSLFWAMAIRDDRVLSQRSEGRPAAASPLARPWRLS